MNSLGALGSYIDGCNFPLQLTAYLLHMRNASGAVATSVMEVEVGPTQLQPTAHLQFN